jgi:hypothetical protein
MPEKYHIDREQRLVWSKFWGVFSDADLLNHQSRLRADPDFVPSFCQMVDMTEVTEVTLDPKVVKQVAESSVFSPQSQRAFLVVKDLVFGIGRMYQLYQEFKGQNSIQVYRDRGKALDWLKVNEVSQLETPVTARPN